MRVEPYLFFEGRCEEAIEFYKRAVGAEVQMLMRYKDAPPPHPPGMTPPGGENKVMHSSLRIGETTLHASDGHCGAAPTFEGFSLSLAVKDDVEAKQKFAALSDGGKVTMPLGKTFFSSSFGMLTDRFGVGWMVIVQQ